MNLEESTSRVFIKIVTKRTLMDSNHLSSGRILVSITKTFEASAIPKTAKVSFLLINQVSNACHQHQ